ncbi:MAG: AraC family transcriptional regulator [Planctomycetes bacterium]|nr:AraC family transcriptional regulator [Planctomycetota bacterium]
MDWSDRINPQLHLCWSGAWRRGTIEPPRLLADHELVVVASGTCHLELAGRSLRLARGGWAIVPVGAWHRSQALDGACVRHCIHFDWEHTGRPPATPWFRFAEHPGGLDATPPPVWLPRELLHGTADPEAVSLAGRVCVRWRAGDRHGARALMLELLLGLVAPRSPVGTDDRSAVLATQVKDLLDRGGPDLGSLRRELRTLGHSYEHLCRCFVRTFGMPPLRYLTLVRMEAAKRLLLDGLPVATVANRLGYSDAAHFTLLFRRLLGLAPTSWLARERTAARHPSEQVTST